MSIRKKRNKVNINFLAAIQGRWPFFLVKFALQKSI